MVHTSRTKSPKANTNTRSVFSRAAYVALPLGLSLAIAPLFSAPAAFAAEDATLQAAQPTIAALQEQPIRTVQSTRIAQEFGELLAEQATHSLAVSQEIIDSAVNKVLKYDPADIAAIGNQNASGHSICCPSYACAYADAVLDGTVHDHDYYTCSCCTWTDWGGGASSFRCVGTDEEVLREAYDQIAAGKPVVTHVSWSGGEHWITLIGYQDAVDPDHLVLGNFIALDPVDGTEVNAAGRFALYGDGCQHISER